MKPKLYATPQDAEAAFYKAIEKADLEAMMAVWADDEDIVCVHPGGTRLVGAEHVRESWRAIFASGHTLRFRLLQRQTLSGMSLAVHSVYEHIAVAGEPRTPAPVIATNIYLRTEHGWRMLMHHASPAPSVPDMEADKPGNTLH